MQGLAKNEGLRRVEAGCYADQTSPPRGDTMTNDQDQDGFLIPALRGASEYAKCISPMEWLGRINSEFKNQGARAVEKYVISCLIIEVAVMILWWTDDLLAAVGWLIVVFAVLRMIEIIVRTAGVTNVISRPRTLALWAINYVELALCFGAIYALK